MRLVDYLDKGASLGPQAPCLRAGERVLSYRDVQERSDAIARALVASGIRPGDKVAILSANDPLAFSCVFGISRAAAVWCPINPRNEARENRQLLELFECKALVYQRSFAGLVAQILPELPQLTVVVCLDGADEAPVGARFDDWLEDATVEGTEGAESLIEIAPADDVAMIAGTGGTTGLPKGVQLTTRNLETMTAIMLMSYPFNHRPRYLALAPLTHAAGVLSFPVLALGGEVIIMAEPSIDVFLESIERHRVTHTMLPPTLLYMLLDHPALETTDVSSLECFWYGSAPMAPARLEEAITRIGPVLAQFFGQTEAPMVATTMVPADHLRADGTIATERLSSAGKAAPLVTVAIMDPSGELLDGGERGEIVLRGSLVTPGYYRDLAATAAVSEHGWHHTGDIGYLDEDGFLFIVDRAKDMIISGGFNVYSAEVEQAILEYDDVLDCAVFGLPDDRWGERVCAVVQARDDRSLDLGALRRFVRERLGGVKAPKDYSVWDDLPRSRVGKVLKREIRASVLAAQAG